MENPSITYVGIQKISDRGVLEAQDPLAVEEPLEIQLFYGPAGRRTLKNISVTMRTPGSDMELALGFLFTEGIIRSLSEVEGVWRAGEYTAIVTPSAKAGGAEDVAHGLAETPTAPASALRVDLHEDAVPTLPSADRNFYATSSCGVCGKASIDAITTVSAFKEASFFQVPSALLYHLQDQLKSHQPLFNDTGGIHASALFDLDGHLLFVREDVGRHNALDKLIGTALLGGMLPLDRTMLLLSGRASFELVQKAVMAGIRMIVAVGAPSSLAVELAKENGITLVGFLREQRFNIYCGMERIKLNEEAAQPAPPEAPVSADALIESPAQLTGLRQGDVKKAAAGLPAVIHSFQHVFGQAGLARGWKALVHMNQKGGFDCPSCAWPDPDDERSGIAEYCENGAKAIAEEATSKKLLPAFFAAHSVRDLSTLTDFDIGRKGRIAQPMFLPKGATHYQPISWDEAFSRVGAALNALASPDEAVFYTSGRTTNEAAYLYQLFAREYGTNNLPDCSNMCHESSGVALSQTVGIGKGSVTLEDLHHAEVIIILGQNPGTNAPRMLSALQKAKQNGALIISVNPLPETGLMGFNNPQQVKGMLGMDTALTDLFLQVKINGDMALVQAIEVLLLEMERQAPGTVFDHAFIGQQTQGFDALQAHLASLDLDSLCAACGVDRAQIEEAALLIRDKKRIIACWAMGLTQHKNAVDTIKEVVNLLLLKGSIGKPGAGTCPVRGHSNVQGDRTVGIYEQPSDAFLDALEKHFHFTAPRKHGYDVVHAIKAMHEGKARVFFGMGGNFLSATPDTVYTAAALRQCALTVHVSTKLNRSHLVHGQEALILPCLGHSDRDAINGEDQFLSCENSMGVVQSSKGILEPISSFLLSEPVIVCRMAKATLGTRSKINWDRYMVHYDAIRDDIEKTIPGFTDYNKKVREPGGFYLPNGPREGRFTTPSGKAQFSVSSITVQTLAPDELMMMTVRSHDQFNTTIYGMDDRYRGIYNERRVILMNWEDIRIRGLSEGGVVDLYNYHGGVERVARTFVVVPYPIPAGCAATYYPETNVLVPIDSVAEGSNTPTSKLVVVKIIAAADSPR